MEVGHCHQRFALQKRFAMTTTPATCNIAASTSARDFSADAWVLLPDVGSVYPGQRAGKAEKM